MKKTINMKKMLRKKLFYLSLFNDTLKNKVEFCGNKVHSISKNIFINKVHFQRNKAYCLKNKVDRFKV